MSSENPRKKTLKNGKVSWEARYRDPAGRQRSKSFPLKRDATDFLSEQRTKMRAGDWIDPTSSKVTLAALADAWVAQAPSPGTGRTRTRLRRNLGEMEHLSISHISPPLIRTWLAELKNGRPWIPDCKGISEAYVASLFSQLKAMLRQAVQDQLILRNPAEKISVPRPATSVAWDEIPTVEELHKFIQLFRDGARKKTVHKLGPGGMPAFDEDGEPVMIRSWVKKSPDLAVAIHTAAATGMRTSEVCGLTRASLDVEGGVIRVNAQAARYGADLMPLKTRDKALRSISVDEGTLELLREHQEAHPGESRLFFNDGGRPLVGGSFALSVKHARQYLGIHKPITPKSFRHFHATELLRAGVPIKTVQARLGHATAKMTLDTYAHVAPDDDGAAAAMIAGILSGVGSVRDSRRGMRVVGD